MGTTEVAERRRLPGISWAALGLVAGFLAGGLGPRLEMMNLAKEKEALADKVIKLERGRSKGFGLGSGLIPGLSEMEAGPRQGPQPNTAIGHTEDQGPTEIGDGTVASGGVVQAPSGQAPAEAPADLREQFDLAAEVQATRAAQSRAALVEQAELSEEEEAELDAILERLEGELAEHADGVLANMMEVGGEPPPAEMLRLTHEVTGALYESQAAMDALLGDRVEGVDPEAALIWNHMELEAFRPAVEAAANRGGQL
jgi:hypothetical protein